MSVYLVRLYITGKWNTESIAENLNLLHTTEKISKVRELEAATQLKIGLLSKDTVLCHAVDVVAGDSEQLLSNLRNSNYWTIQPDEWSDAANTRELLGFIKERLLCCKAMTRQTTGECSFKIFQEAVKHFHTQRVWHFLIHTDGANTMTRKNNSEISHFQHTVPNTLCPLCSTHYSALAALQMSKFWC